MARDSRGHEAIVKHLGERHQMEIKHIKTRFGNKEKEVADIHSHFADKLATAESKLNHQLEKVHEGKKLMREGAVKASQVKRGLMRTSHTYKAG